jgi:hypothetical protein
MGIAGDLWQITASLKFTESLRSASGKNKGPRFSSKSLFLLVGARGFEPPTPATPLQCATRLRHAPTVKSLATLRKAASLDFQ